MTIPTALDPWDRVTLDRYTRSGWLLKRTGPPFRKGWIAVQPDGMMLRGRTGRFRVFKSEYLAAEAANKAMELNS